MPNALLLEIIEAIMTLAADAPQIVTLAESAAGIIQVGTVSPADAAAIRAQLDAVKGQIDAA